MQYDEVIQAPLAVQGVSSELAMISQHHRPAGHVDLWKASCIASEDEIPLALPVISRVFTM